MGRRLLLILGFAILCATVLFFSCGQPDNSSSPNNPSYTVTGTINPLAAPQILTTICNKLLESHRGLSESECLTGVRSASFSGTLGVPMGSLDPFAQLLALDQSGVLMGSPVPLAVCLTDIAALDPNSQLVQNAYLPSAHHPFDNVIDMIPQGAGSCGSIYPPVVPGATPSVGASPPGVNLVNFDDPEPQGPPDENVLNTYAGINFMGQWLWQGPYNADNTNSIYFATPAAGSGQFSLPSGTTLISLSVFNGDLVGETGTLTVQDAGGNPVVTVGVIADGQMHLIETGWTNPVSNPVTISFSDGTFAGWVLGVDNIEYK